jgi:hypothetical protein
MAKIALPYQDHYDVALRRELDRLKQRWDSVRLDALGAQLDGRTAVLPTLSWRLRLTVEPFSMVLLPDGKSCSIVWQILVLNYLNAAPPALPARFLSFADFAEARAYLSVFDGRVNQRLARSVGRTSGALAEAAERCGGVRGTETPQAYLFRFFPRFELQVVRYEGDDDFPPACNVLFPDNAMSILSPEAAVVAAELLVSALKGNGPAS